MKIDIKLVWCSCTAFALCLYIGYVYKFGSFTIKVKHQYEWTEKISREQSKGIVMPGTKLRERTIKILYWTQPHVRGQLNNSAVWGWGFRNFTHCQVSQCYATADRSQINSSDVIMINPRVLHEVELDLPRYRHGNQVWLLTTWEAPQRFPIDRNSSALFNATYTYRHNSDVRMRRYVVESKQDTSNATDGKSRYQANGRPKRLVSWVVSNCHDAPSERWHYASLLRRYIEVDIYGKCGNLSCPDGQQCHLMISESYLFYLAFENSLCEDYLTEKVWRPLQLGLIPVVYGGANYSQYLPPNSYIDVRNFTSVKSVAKRLVDVSINQALYDSYHAWRKTHYIKPVDKSCEACRALHELQERLPQTIDPTYWEEKNNCQDPSWMQQLMDYEENN